MSGKVALPLLTLVSEYTGLGVAFKGGEGLVEVLGVFEDPVGPYTGFGIAGPPAVRISFLADWTFS